MLGKMGSGKTLFATLYAYEYSKRFPNNTIYANYRIGQIRNFKYTPYGFLPFSILKDCLIVLDDIYALIDLRKYIGIIVNLSRKRNIEIILTGQYYTMFSRQQRMLADYIVLPTYDKITDTLHILTTGNMNTEYVIHDAVKKAKTLYETNEVVLVPNDNRIIESILEITKDPQDIYQNLKFVFNKQKVEKIIKNLEIENSFSNT